MAQSSAAARCTASVSGAGAGAGGRQARRCGVLPRRRTDPRRRRRQGPGSTTVGVPAGRRARARPRTAPLSSTTSACGLRLGRGLGRDHVRGDRERRRRVAFDDHGVLGASASSPSTRDAGQHLDPRLEVQLHADAVRLLRRAQPQHVALADGGLVLHPLGVHVHAPRRARVVDGRLVEVGPQLRVDRADPGKLHHQVAVGIGADQDLGHDLVGVVTAPVKGTTEDGERDEPQVAL